MKNKIFPTWILILIALIAATTGAYALGRLVPDLGLLATPGQPPLLRVDIPTQTQNGITVTIEGVYADAIRIVFAVRMTGNSGNYFMDRVSLKNEHGVDINASMGIGSMNGHAPSITQIEFNPVIPLKEHLKGKLDFAVMTSPGDGESIAQFSFDLDLPVHPALTFNPKQVTTANGTEILLDRIVITPAYTQVYLCYIKPTDADWGIGCRLGNRK